MQILYVDSTLSAHRSAFDQLDVISAELEQRHCAIDVHNTRDLSRFEEIDAIGTYRVSLEHL